MFVVIKKGLATRKLNLANTTISQMQRLTKSGWLIVEYIQN